VPKLPDDSDAERHMHMHHVMIYCTCTLSQALARFPGKHMVHQWWTLLHATAYWWSIRAGASASHAKLQLYILIFSLLSLPCSNTKTDHCLLTSGARCQRTNTLPSRLDIHSFLSLISFPLPSPLSTFKQRRSSLAATDSLATVSLAIQSYKCITLR
jgi:hypothetical protein